MVKAQYQWGMWKPFTELEGAPSYRELLEHVLDTTPDYVLDTKVLALDSVTVRPFSIFCKDPTPTYEDPLGQKGFVSWKFTYEK